MNARPAGQRIRSSRRRNDAWALSCDSSFATFPLTTVHPHAQHAAEAAEAAGAQGRFWEMHDTLFEHQSALTDAALIGYAKALALNTTRFAHELQQHRYAARVREDVDGGLRSGVNGTPTFYINGVRHDAPYNLEIFMTAVSAAAAAHRSA